MKIRLLTVIILGLVMSRHCNADSQIDRLDDAISKREFL